MLLRLFQVVLVAIVLQANAMGMQDEEKNFLSGDTHLSLEAGLDAWHMNSSVKAPDDPRARYFANQFLYLPDSYTQWNYRDVSPWLKLAVRHNLAKGMVVNLKFDANQSVGSRLNELSLDKAISPFLGFRAGLVSYKTTWCRTYDADSPWMREPDAFCSVSSFREIRDASPGAQVYANFQHRDFLYQAILGVYRPRAFNYAPREFSDWWPTPAYQVTQNDKIGASLNVMHMETGDEFRLSWLRAKQVAFSPEPTVLGTTRQETDLIYAGLNHFVTPSLSIRGTYSLFGMNNTCVSEVGNYYDCADALADRRTFKTIELIYRLGERDAFALGRAEYRIRSALSFRPGQSAPLVVLNDFYRQSNRQTALSWRHEWGGGVFSIVQWSYADHFTKYVETDPLTGTGHAVGVRVGYRY